MHKTLILLSALCTSALAAAPYHVDIRNNSGSKKFRFTMYTEERSCWCVKNVQTGSITGVNGGKIKLFSTTDCSGNYQTLEGNSKVSNTQWVNSFSYGVANVPSQERPGYCPDWYGYA
ncbi:hypothetical protein BGZ74_006638 [Mortierella antarctica]|nr:hypothetical protein BGZ74_006638 [Mortierella antarctica]KAG0350135.1 hypothetical protein BG005_010334 [Podila minutissima]